jgi:hypothetical protein
MYFTHSRTSASKMQRVVTPLTKQTIGNPETVTFRNRNTEK